MPIQDPDLRELMARGQSLFRAKEPVRAREVFREAVLLAEQRYGPDAPELRPCIFWVFQTFSAWQEDEPGDWAEAVALGERALRLAGTSPPAEGRYIVAVAVDLAIYKQAMGHRDEALALVRRAVQAWSQGDSTTSHVDDRHLGLCEFLLDFGQPLEALDFAERLSRAVEQMPLGRTKSRLLRVAGYLIGRSLLDLGRYDEARTRVMAGLAALPEPSPGEESPFRQRLERLLGEILLRRMSILRA